MRGYLGHATPIPAMTSLRFSTAELEGVRERITGFIEAQAAAAADGEAVIGLSGGIDSSLTATLAVEALGPDSVLGIAMPAAVSAERHRSDAAELANDLDIPFETVEIEPIVEAVADAYPRGELGTSAHGNTSARARAALLYAISNEEERLVLGTGNRSEALVGYFTKFGDGAVDCHPIGNLYKCQVRQLARHVGVREAIVEKTPTAELWADQTDEGELDLAYDTLDTILALHVDGPYPREATAEVAECTVEAVDRVTHMVETSAHKRRMPPTP